MIFFLIVALLSISCTTSSSPVLNTYSEAVGYRDGIAFSTQEIGKITGIRIWQRPFFISGLQVCADEIWGEVYGVAIGNYQELLLRKDERIIQVSGYSNRYISQLTLVTSEPRVLTVGIPSEFPFNFFAERGAGLRRLRGHYNKFGITALGACWGDVEMKREF